MKLERRPLYIAASDVGGGWGVTARRGRRGRGGFTWRAEAVAHAERLAAGHPIAQVRVFGGDGALLRDEAMRHPARCREAQEWLGDYPAPFRDCRRARAVLVEERHAEDRQVEVAGEALRLPVAMHEGRAGDEIYLYSTCATSRPVPASGRWASWCSDGDGTRGRHGPEPVA